MKKILFLTGFLGIISMVRSVFISGVHNNNTVFLAGISFMLFLYGYFYDKFVKMKWLTVAICTIVFSVISFSAFLGVYGRRSTVLYNEEIVLVLGGGTLNGEPRTTLARRLDKAVEYHRRNPNAVIIVSGGVGHREVLSEAEIMAGYLIDRGVSPEVIILENRAYSTYSNMRFSRALLDFDVSDLNTAVITSDFHMYRSVRFAERAGFYNITAYPSGTPWYALFFAYLREVAAVVKMWVIGR